MKQEKRPIALHSQEVVEKNDLTSNAAGEKFVGLQTEQIKPLTSTSSSLPPPVSSLSSSAIKPEKKILSNKIYESRNWLIHQLFIRQEYMECLCMAEKQLQECRGICEYALYIKALLMRRNGELTESLKFFQTALLINPVNIMTKKQVAQALLLLGKHKAAIEAFKEAEMLCINNGNEIDWLIYYNMGICYIYLEDYENAEVALLSALNIKKEECCIIQLGKIYIIQKDYERAIFLYEEGVQLFSTNPNFLTTLGLLYIKIGNSSKAFNYIGKCLTLNSSNPIAIMAAASIMQEHGDFNVALNKYRIAISKLPHSAYLWSNIGMCFFAEQKNIYAAVACLQKSVFLAPFEWRILYNIGIVFLHLRQYASAFHYLSAATRLNTKYASGFMYLGVTLALMDDLENACEAYSRALFLEESPLILLNYTITLINCKQHCEAKKQFEKFLYLWGKIDEKEQRKFGLSIPCVARNLAEIFSIGYKE